MSAPHSAHSTTSRPGEFDRADRSALLALARHTIAAALGRPAPGPVDRAVFATPRGAFVTVQHEDPLRLVAALARHHIVADAAGDRLRLCPDILNTESELAQVAEELGALLAR